MVKQMFLKFSCRELDILNDKHIRQYSEVLMNESSIMEINRDIPEQVWETMIEMYKKGYQDCLHDAGQLEWLK